MAFIERNPIGFEPPSTGTRPTGITPFISFSTSSTSTTTIAASSNAENNTPAQTPAQPPAGSSTSSSVSTRKFTTTIRTGGPPSATNDGSNLAPPADTGPTTSTVEPLASSIQSTTSTLSTSASSATPVLQSFAESSSNGAPTATIVAAVIVPIVVLALIFVFFFMLCKRRRRPRRSTNATFPPMKERSTARDNANGTAEPFVPPIMTSNTNTSYYTGLDTGSERGHSGEFYAAGRSDSSSFTEPPPPYKAKTHDPSGGPIQASAIGGVPVVRLPTGIPASPPSPDSWATAPRDAAFLDTGSAFGRSSSRATTDPSINSDLYSDGASIHSARAARRSIGGANVIGQTANASQDGFNPFDDPASPVSSVDDDEVRSFTNLPSRAISPVSFRSRS